MWSFVKCLMKYFVHFSTGLSLSLIVLVLYIFWILALDWIWVIQSPTIWFVFSLSFSYLLMNRSPSLPLIVKILKVANIYGDYQMPDTIQWILHRITHSILIMTLWGKSYYPYFSDEETESRRLQTTCLRRPI